MLDSADLQLPIGFTPFELLRMLDHDGDGVLTCDEFVQSLYRTIEGGSFQHMCLLQTSLNTLVVEVKDQREVLSRQLAQLETRLVSVLARPQIDMPQITGNEKEQKQ